MQSLNFSVAMSVYKNDNPIFFDNALESIIIMQTLKPNEIVLIVDGPISDQLEEVIIKYSNIYKNFNIIRLDKNHGLGNALKIAVENCKYDLIARMDSDDISVSTRFAQQIKFFKENNTDIVGGNITEFIQEKDNIVSKREVPILDSDIKKYAKKRCPLNHVTVMFKKKSVLECGGYLDCFWNEDYFLWIRMWRNCCIFSNTGTDLVNVRISQDMFKRRGGIKYFKSELFIQKYMLSNKMINFITYFDNCIKRFILEILLPNKIREIVYKRFARRRSDE